MSTQRALLLLAFAGVTGFLIYEAVAIRRQANRFDALQEQSRRFLAAGQQATRGRDEALRRVAAVESAGKTAQMDVRDPGTPPVAASDPVADGLMALVGRLKERLAQMPEKQIPELALLTDQEWLVSAQNLQWSTDEEARRAINALRSTAKMKLGEAVENALQAYASANGDQLPSEVGQLARFLNPPVPAEMLQRYEILRGGSYSQAAATADWLVAEKGPVDEQFDSRQLVSAARYAQVATNPAAYLTLRAIAAFSDRNGGGKPAAATDLLAYLEAPLDPAKLESVFRDWQSEPATLGLKVSRSVRRSSP